VRCWALLIMQKRWRVYNPDHPRDYCAGIRCGASAYNWNQGRLQAMRIARLSRPGISAARPPTAWRASLPR
jgi:hypothetical protein